MGNWSSSDGLNISRIYPADGDEMHLKNMTFTVITALVKKKSFRFDDFFIG